MSVLDRTAVARPAPGGAVPARVDTTGAISHSRLVTARATERPHVRLVTFGALAACFMTSAKYVDQPTATVLAPRASSRMRSHPMIQATSSPRLAYENV